MLTISNEFMAESLRDGNQPVLFMDIWADKGAQRRLSKATDWSGINDAAVGLDVGVSATRVKDSLILDNGTDVPLTGSGFTGLVSHVMNYRVDVTSRTKYHGFFSGHKFDHFDRVTVSNDFSIVLPFTAVGTFLCKDIRLSVNNTGNSATSVNVRIVDSAGNQVGFKGSTAVAAHSGQIVVDVVGLSASLRKGFKYRLEIGYNSPSSPGVQQNSVATTVYSVSLNVSSYSIGAYAHTIAFASGDGFVISGKNGFQPSGSAVRTLDVGATAIGDGILTFKDIVPTGTSMTITMYYTDSAVIATEPTLTNWTLHGVAASGDILTAHQWWRAKIDMTSNSLNDETPTINEISISYIGDPVIISENTVVELVPDSPEVYQVVARTGLDSVSTATAQLTPKPTKSMIGRVSVTLLPEDAVNGLMNKKLRGRPVRIRAGYVGITETIPFYEGIVRDMAWSRGKYTLTVQDTIELADVSVPRIPAGLAWSSVTEYAIGDILVHGTNSWESVRNVLTGIVNPLAADGADGDYWMNSATSVMFTKTAGAWNAGSAGITPELYPTAWRDNGTVWQDIGYTTATNGGVDWSLVDIAKDLIINRINLNTENVDFNSLTRFPLRTGSRTLTKPVKAFEMLSELAWLLEAQWAVVRGQLSLVPEPLSADLPVEAVQVNDVMNNPTYRRGWAELKNESLIVTGYTGAGSNEASFNTGVAVADKISIHDYDIAALDTFQDKWNVPLAELTTIAKNFVNRWKNGRRVIPSAQVQMRLLRLEVGDVVTFDSIDMPPADPPPYKMMVLKKDVDWKKQTLKMSFIEVV